MTAKLYRHAHCTSPHRDLATNEVCVDTSNSFFVFCSEQKSNDDGRTDGFEGQSGNYMLSLWGAGKLQRAIKL